MKRQRGSFRPLTQLYTGKASALGHSGMDIPSSVAKWFPDSDDAATLKRDLMDGGILADAQVDAVFYLCTVDKGRSLPAPSEAGLRNLADKWPTRSSDMMKLAEWATSQAGELADALLSTVAKVIPPSNFWSVTEGFPEMRRRMVANQPDLLDAEPIATVDPASLMTLLDAVPVDHEVGAALVRRMLAPVDARIVKKAFERFPRSTSTR